MSSFEASAFSTIATGAVFVATDGHPMPATSSNFLQHGSICGPSYAYECCWLATASICRRAGNDSAKDLTLCRWSKKNMLVRVRPSVFFFVLFPSIRIRVVTEDRHCSHITNQAKLTFTPTIFSATTHTLMNVVHECCDQITRGSLEYLVTKHIFWHQHSSML